MFTIDLLKGRGLPKKSSPKEIAARAALLVIPVILTVVIASYYIGNKITMGILSKEIVNYQSKMGDLMGNIKFYRSFEKEKDLIECSLTDVAKAVVPHKQWSPIIVDLIKNLPDSIILTRLNAKQEMAKRAEQNAAANVQISRYALTMSVSGSSVFNFPNDVKDFKNKICNSPLFSDKLEDVKISQISDMVNNSDMISYEIDVVFKPQL